MTAGNEGYGDEQDVVYFVCLDEEVKDGNGMVLCDGVNSVVHPPCMAYALWRGVPL